MLHDPPRRFRQGNSSAAIMASRRPREYPSLPHSEFEARSQAGIFLPSPTEVVSIVFTIITTSHVRATAESRVAFQDSVGVHNVIVNNITAQCRPPAFLAAFSLSRFANSLCLGAASRISFLFADLFCST
jgi:hypothetical protein